MKFITGFKTVFCVVVFILFARVSEAQITLANANGDVTTVIAGTNNVPIFAMNVSKSGSPDLSGVKITFNAPIAGKVSNLRLYKSSDQTFGGDTQLGTTFSQVGATDEYQITFTAFGVGGGAGDYLFVVGDIDAAAGGQSFTVNCAASQLTATGGAPTGSASNSVSITAITATFTQLADASSAFQTQASVILLNFSGTTDGTQTLTAPLIFKFNRDVSSILQNFDFRVNGSNPASTTYTLTPGGDSLRVAGFSPINLPSSPTTSNFQLLANISAGVSNSSDFTIDLASTGITVNPATKTLTPSPFTNSVDVYVLTSTVAEITPGTAPVSNNSVLFAGTSGTYIAGFSYTPTADQTISAINFNYTVAAGAISTKRLFRSTTAGAAGTEVTNNTTTDGQFTGLSQALTGGTTYYYYLVVDVANSVTSLTGGFTVNPTQANITVTQGTVGSFSINRAFTFNTSQASDITFTGGSTSAFTYRTLQAATIDDTNLSLSQRLATFRVRDGGSSATDSDNKGTSITSITMTITKPANLRRVALFNDGTNVEIAGTEQDMPGSGTVTFTPSTPIRTSDNGTFDIIVRGTFNSSVVDNDTIIVTITNVVGEAGYSGFASANAGGANSSTATNKTIIVTVSKFVFLSPAPPTSVAVNTNFSATVRAVDQLNNTDTDFTGQVGLAVSGGSGSISATPQPLTPTLVGGKFDWTALKINQAGNYTITASDDAYADAYQDAFASISVSSSPSTITQASLPNICYGNGFSNLGNIVITETDNAGFSGSSGTYSFSVALPTGFVFDQTVTSGASRTGSTDITAITTYSYPSANIVEFSFTLAGTTEINSITLSGLKVGRPHPGTVSPTGTGTLNITRSGGSANISGVTSGTVLGTVSAIQSNPATDFTVVRINASDFDVPPNTREFDVNSASVQLVGTTTPGVFTGSGVTFTSGQYRFNPGTLSPGSYPITYTQTTGGSGCQSVAKKDFVVFSSGISGLGQNYCNNDAKVTGLAVADAFAQQVSGPGRRADRLVYFNPFISSWVNLPSNTFNPQDPLLLSISEFYGRGVPVGFYVCDIVPGIPCNGASNLFGTYQWVKITRSPAVTYALPNDTFCRDNVPITLVGTPPNSTNDAFDRFVVLNNLANAGGAVSNSVVGSERIWTFSATSVGGVASGTDQSFSLAYIYRDPVTTCSDTSIRTITVKFRPPTVVGTVISKTSPVLPLNNLLIQLCQGSSVGSFIATASPSAPPTIYKWYADANRVDLRGTGNTFTPPIDVNSPGVSDFFVTQTTGATSTFEGCESDVSGTPPLKVDVSVIQSPTPPIPSFPDANRQYCIGDIPNNAQFVVVPSIGTVDNVKWYNANSPSTVIFSGASPHAVNDLGISTAAATTYQFNVTQTDNQCEGPPLIVKATVKALPSLTLTADSDPSRICTTGNLIRFTASDRGGPAPNGTWSGTGLAGSGTLNPFPLNSYVILNPINLTPGNYVLRYTYTDGASLCTNKRDTTITILPTITPDVSIGDVCFGSPAIITNNSAINGFVGRTATIDSAEWRLGDGSSIPKGFSSSSISLNNGRTTGTFLNPRHVYPNVGTFQLTGVLYTSDGCRYSIPDQTVTVSPLPQIDFTWGNICRDVTTGQSTTTFKARETSSPQVTINTYEWNFKVNNVLTLANTPTQTQNTTANYSNNGTDFVRLVATSNALCRDTVTKQIFIVPAYPVIAQNNSYVQDFEGGVDGWIAGGANSSWALGLPQKTIINSASSGTNAWATSLTGNNNPNESSWVLSNCYSFQANAKPVIAIDIFSNTPRGVDGAVLQYTDSANIENDANWKTVGSVGSGVNWYDAQGIANSPGNQASGDIGWTGDILSDRDKYNKWQRALFKLDDYVKGKSNIVFRIAFASSQGSKEGFAFDNVFIGERSRVVLLESFTNISTTDNNAHNAQYAAFANGDTTEVVKIQYHTAFPGYDSINYNNRQMHNARTAFYGITSAPAARVDGRIAPVAPTSFGWVQKEYDDRVLEPAPLRIEPIQAVKSGTSVKINVRIRNTSLFPVATKGAHVFVTILKKAISGVNGQTMVYVAREILPSNTGIPVPENLAAGEFFDIPEVSWDFRTGDAIAVHIQKIEGNPTVSGFNKEVLQARAWYNPPLPDLSIVTSVTDPGQAEVSVYPNPADEVVEIVLPEAVKVSTPVGLFDSFGKPVIQGTFESGESSKAFYTQNLSAGVYFIIANTKAGIFRKKIVVVHD